MNRFVACCLGLWCFACVIACERAPAVLVTLAAAPGVHALEVYVVRASDGRIRGPVATDALDRFRVQFSREDRGTLRVHVIGLDAPQGCGVAVGVAEVTIGPTGEVQPDAVPLRLNPDVPRTCRLELDESQRDAAEGSVMVDVAADPEKCPGARACWSAPRGTRVKLTPNSGSAYQFAGWRVFSYLPGDSATPPLAMELLDKECASLGPCTLSLGSTPFYVRALFEPLLVCPGELCWEHPQPVGVPLQMVRGTNFTNGPPAGYSTVVWFLGEDETLFQWDGLRWRSASRLVGNANTFLGDTWLPTGIGVPWTGQLVVYGGNGVMLKQGNGSWFVNPAMARSFSDLKVISAWVTQGPDITSVGNPNSKPWFLLGTPSTLTDGTSSVWSVPANVGALGLNAVWGLKAGDRALVLGQRGLLLRCDRAAFTCVTELAAPPAASLNAIDGQDDDLWVVGDKGVALRWDQTWQVVHPATDSAPDLRSVWRPGPGRVWALSSGPESPLLLDETQARPSWQAVEPRSGRTAGALTSLWGEWTPKSKASAAPPRGWAVSDEGEILRHDCYDEDLCPGAPRGECPVATQRQCWREVSDAKTREDLCAVFSVDDQEGSVWAVGKGAAVLRRQGVTWSLVERSALPVEGASPALLGLWGTPDDGLWVVGTERTFWHRPRRQDETWEKGPLPAGVPEGMALTAITGVPPVGASPLELWFIGTAGEAADSMLFHYRDALRESDRVVEQIPLPAPTKDQGPRRLHGLWATRDAEGKADLFLVGDADDGAILWRRRGDAWDPRTPGDVKKTFSNGESLRAVFGVGGTVWAVGGARPAAGWRPCDRESSVNNARVAVRLLGDDWTDYSAKVAVGTHIALWARNTDLVWGLLQGNRPKITRWKKETLEQVQRSRFGYLRGLTGNKKGQVWFVGDRGAILSTRP